MGSNPTVCAKGSTLRGAAFYFCGKLCKSCKVGFEQPVPGALRPAGLQQSCGLLQGRGRIPPSAPRAAPCRVLLFIFAANYARVARWDSNSPCPALCVPPGCNSPADCCKGAGALLFTHLTMQRQRLRCLRKKGIHPSMNSLFALSILWNI